MSLVEFSIDNIAGVAPAWIERSTFCVVIKVSSYECIEKTLRCSFKRYLSVGVRPENLSISVFNPYGIDQETKINIEQIGATQAISTLLRCSYGKATCRKVTSDMYECEMKVALKSDICENSKGLQLIHPLTQGPGCDYMELSSKCFVDHRIDGNGVSTIWFSELVFQEDRTHVVYDVWCRPSDIKAFVYNGSGACDSNMIHNEMTDETWSKMIQVLTKVCGVSVKVVYSERDPYNGYRVIGIELHLMVPRVHLDLIRMLGGPNLM